MFLDDNELDEDHLSYMIQLFEDETEKDFVSIKTLFSLIFSNLTGSGVSLSSSDGLFGVFLELFEVLLGGCDLDVVVVVSESLHCSTSTSTSLSSVAKRSTDEGPYCQKNNSISSTCSHNESTQQVLQQLKCNFHEIE